MSSVLYDGAVPPPLRPVDPQMQKKEKQGPDDYPDRCEEIVDGGEDGIGEGKGHGGQQKPAGQGGHVEQFWPEGEAAFAAGQQGQQKDAAHQGGGEDDAVHGFPGAGEPPAGRQQHPYLSGDPSLRRGEKGVGAPQQSGAEDLKPHQQDQQDQSCPPDLSQCPSGGLLAV